MAKRSPKKKKIVKKAKVNNIENRNEIEYLNMLVDLSMRCVDGRSEQLDIVFKGQASKLLDQISKLKGKQ